MERRVGTEEEAQLKCEHRGHGVVGIVGFRARVVGQPEGDRPRDSSSSFRKRGGIPLGAHRLEPCSGHCSGGRRGGPNRRSAHRLEPLPGPHCADERRLLGTLPGGRCGRLRDHSDALVHEPAHAGILCEPIHLQRAHCKHFAMGHFPTRVLAEDLLSDLDLAPFCRGGGVRRPLLRDTLTSGSGIGSPDLHARSPLRQQLPGAGDLLLQPDS
mmetsp:Transcript_65609/g.140252  ORF Transcript_65609/g.140252 Transcript_65609/m.140252 type:complete len:213 (-) Transcript_65609:459-1097(-)